MSMKMRVLLVVVISALLVLIQHYRNQYLIEQDKNAELTIKHDLLQITVNTYKNKEASRNRIDQQTQEKLQHAQDEINNLRDKLRTSDVGVYIKTETNACEVRKSSTASVVNAERARLSNANQQDFLDLKERAEQSKIMIEGLQNYIKTVCLNEN